MTDYHPITPLPELVASLRKSAPHGIGDCGVTRELWLIDHAYAAGADQELEACLKWMGSFCATWTCGRRPEDVLRAARRPKPPSLKERIAAAITAGDERTALSLLNEALPE